MSSDKAYKKRQPVSMSTPAPRMQSLNIISMVKKKKKITQFPQETVERKFEAENVREVPGNLTILESKD